MIGFVIENEKQDRLTQGKWWGAGNGWIFTEQEVDTILKESTNWQTRPFRIIPAQLVEDGVALVGKPQGVLEFIMKG